MMFYLDLPDMLRHMEEMVYLGKISLPWISGIQNILHLLEIKEKAKELAKKPNYLTVPAAIRELEKIELVRQTDGKYRMDHAVTVTQKIILKAFDMDADQIQDKAVGLSRLLEKYAEEGK